MLERSLVDPLAKDVTAVGRIDCVPTILKIICETTGMGFAAVARVTDQRWMACAVHDTVAFGLRAGGELPLDSTLCKEAREARRVITIDQASTSPVYRDHHTPRLYRIESYVSMPIVLPDGEYFGNLCAIDPKPAAASDVRTVTMFERFAELIALQLQAERAALKIEAMMAREHEESRQREEFIAVLAHDLRNPLQAILMHGSALERKGDALGQRSGTAIRRHVARMTTLIDDTLDFARGRLGGGVSCQLAECRDLAGALLAVVDEVQTGHPERRLDVRIEPLLPIVCDEGRMQQLLSNLVGNAVHHGSDAQPVRVTVEGRGDELRIEVWNDGAPIPEALLPHVFEPFRQGDPERDRSNGLGLGLFICARIAEAHGGSIAVRSSAAEGTWFTVGIPMRHGEPSPVDPPGEALPH